MSLHKFVSLLLAVPLVLCAQQRNGRNYTPQATSFGEPSVIDHDTGVANYVLTTPFTTGAGPYTAWGACHIYIVAPDSTKSWGCALYSATTRLCYTFAATPAPVAGWNTVPLTGCGVPSPNTSYNVAQLTASSTQQPGYQRNTCPPSTTAYSKYASGSSFPATLAAGSAQTFCYSAYIDAYLAGSDNGALYGPVQATNVPLGPWSAGGKYYGATYPPTTLVSFNGLTSGAAPTTTQLGNGTTGGACTWSVTNAHASMTGSNTAALPSMLSPAVVGGAGYGGTTGMSLHYATGTGGDYVECVLGSSYTTLSVGYTFETTIPTSDLNWYDDVTIKSTDLTDSTNMVVRSTSYDLYAFLECISTQLGTTNSINQIPIKPNTIYRALLTKNTNSALNSLTVYTQAGASLGTVTCASGSGAHPANAVFVGVTGSEAETAGYWKEWNNVEICTNGGQCGP